MRLFFVVVLAIALLASPALLWAQEKLSKSEAEEMIEAYKQRLEECNARVAEQDKTLDPLRKQIADLDEQIAALEKEIADLKGRMKSSYTVKEGDWLAKLAEYPEVYGKGNYAWWPKIYKANKDKIKDPNLIYPGQVLIVPRD
jgi:nucleoid-associated protein YgaU